MNNLVLFFYFWGYFLLCCLVVVIFVCFLFVCFFYVFFFSLVFFVFGLFFFSFLKFKRQNWKCCQLVSIDHLHKWYWKEVQVNTNKTLKKHNQKGRNLMTASPTTRPPARSPAIYYRRAKITNETTLQVFALIFAK
jgi:hypothetical protein